GLRQEAPFGVEHVDLLAVAGDLAVDTAELALELHDLVLHLEHGPAGDDDGDGPESGAGADHGVIPQAGAAVRSAARSRADRARGLAAISAAPGTMGFFVSRRKVGAGPRSVGR